LRNPDVQGKRIFELKCAGEQIAPQGMLKKPAQQGRSERKAEAYFVPYVEALSEARTPLEGFCNILRVLQNETLIPRYR
jgi:hypothetical protein